MLPKKIHEQKIFLIIFDYIFISILLYFFLKLQYSFFSNEKFTPTFSQLIDAHYKAYFLIIISWYVIADYVKIYKEKRIVYFRELVKKIIYQSIGFYIIITTISGLKETDLLSTKLSLIFIILIFLYLFITRLFIFYLKRYKYNKGIDLKNVLIIGENNNSNKLKAILNHRKHFGYKVFEDQKNSTIETVTNSIINNKIKEVFISQSGVENKFYEVEILNYCERNHIKINYIPYSLDNYLMSLEVEYIDTLPVFKMKKYRLEKVNNQIIKSIFDICFSILVFVFLLSWLFPIIALLIKIDSKGNIFFKQERKGLNGKVFSCYKFRTMKNDGTNSIKSTTLNDMRITKIGKFLRKTSLDELPQFINVLKGEMSIVGPRPHMVYQDNHYSEIIETYNLRYYVKPGITGLSQIKGFRGAIDCDKDMEDRVRIDIFYVRNWSLLLDIQIIYQTIELVIKGDENAI